VAFEPGRRDRVLVVDPATGRVERSVGGPGSFGYAVSLEENLAYLPVAMPSCRLAIVRVPLAGFMPGDGTYRRVAMVRGGWVDDVDAQPALRSDGQELAVVVASPPATDSGMNPPPCGGTDRVAIVTMPSESVRYVAGPAGVQLDDLAWDGGKLIALATSPSRPKSAIAIEIGPHTGRLASAAVVLREPIGHPRPVFRWGPCLAVIDAGAIHCVRHSRIAVRPLPGTSGLPSAVDRVSVADNGRDLLVQTAPGRTYWWDGHAVRAIPVTVPGQWDEPTW
jgi:hypothetical protein